MKTLSQLRTMLDNGETTAVALTQAYLDHIEKHNPKLNALITVTPEIALAQAQHADEIIQVGKQSALTGIPIIHKDLFCTMGVKTTCGSKILENFNAPYNATVVQNLQNAGMVMLGKANMDEFGMGSTNENSAYGAVSNPWNTDCVSGGSSGGSAAAVAAGFAPFATGSDTGGSVRQPASFCGLTGFKPSYGHLSRYGMIAYASSFDQAGIFTHNIDDAAVLLDVMAQNDGIDSTCIGTPSASFFQDGLKGNIAEMTIGVDERLISALPEALEQSFHASIESFKNAGAHIKTVELPDLEPALSAYYILAPAEAAANLARFDGVRYGYRSQNADTLDALYANSRSEAFGAEVKRRIMMGNFVLAASQYDAYYHKAQQVRALLTQQLNALYQTVDMILLPTAPTTAFKKNEKSDPISAYLSDIYTIPANLAGLPAVSFPIGFEQGLPIGAQLMAKAFTDDKLITAVKAFQQNTQWHLHKSPIGEKA